MRVIVAGGGAIMAESAAPLPDSVGFEEQTMGMVIRCDRSDGIGGRASFRLSPAGNGDRCCERSRHSI
ncbi:hypothetical protein [Paenibacillus sp. GYB003]|uniref:hypothetical protein n=1 Tax=Paenibacillus sp. GYB003 TaxID=2994392 RepID=UPI002F9657B5